MASPHAMELQTRAQQRGGCGAVINIDAWFDPDAVPSTAGLCDSARKHLAHTAKGLSRKGFPRA